jgi:hypothetical protein
MAKLECPHCDFEIAVDHPSDCYSGKTPIQCPNCGHGSKVEFNVLMDLLAPVVVGSFLWIPTYLALVLVIPLYADALSFVISIIGALYFMNRCSYHLVKLKTRS